MECELARLGPYPPHLRKRFKSITFKDAFRLVRRQGLLTPLPTPRDVTLVLKGGDLILIEPHRDREGREVLGYYVLWREDFPWAPESGASRKGHRDGFSNWSEHLTKSPGKSA